MWLSPCVTAIFCLFNILCLMNFHKKKHCCLFWLSLVHIFRHIDWCISAMHSKYIWCHSIYSFNMGRWNGWCYLWFPHRPYLLFCGKYIFCHCNTTQQHYLVLSFILVSSQLGFVRSTVHSRSFSSNSYYVQIHTVHICIHIFIWIYFNENVNNILTLKGLKNWG